MKLNFDTRLRGQEARPAAVHTTEENDRTEPLSAAEKRQQAREDRIELSKEALEYLQGQKGASEPEKAASEPLSPEEKRQQAQMEKAKAVRQMLDVVRQQSAQMKEQSKKQTDALKESLDKMKRCAKIARNISKGHKVPPKDEKYLLENDPKAYMMAMALRMLEEQDNKRVKSELKDEENQRQDTGSEYADLAEGASAASVDAAADVDVSVE